MPQSARTPFIAVGLVLGVLGATIAAQPAAAADDHPPIIGMIANTTAPDRFEQPQLYGDGDIHIVAANRKHIELRFRDPANAAWSKDVDFTRSDGADLTVGTVTLAHDSRWEVRDIAFDASGVPTRFDITFLYAGYSPANASFGQVRMGEPEQDVRFSSTDLTWPQTAVGSTRIWATQAIHNASGTPQRLGRAVLGGAHAADFALTDDACSGTTLAAGATCTVRVGFSPKNGGPRVADLGIPVAGKSVRTSLAGSSPVGTSSLTVSGNNWIALNRTRVDADGPLAMFQGSNGSPGTAVFSSQQVYSSTTAFSRLSLTPVGSSTLGNGIFHAGEVGDGSPLLLDISRASRDCNGTDGSATISDLALAPDGSVDRARVRFSVACGNDPRPGPVTGELLWRYRSDVTAPRGASPVTVSTAGTPTVTWGTSSSSDAATTIVRLVPGDGSGATPTSGAAVATSSTAGSATIAGLPTGRQYSVMVWVVDRTGNVSGVLRRSLTT